MDRGLSAVESGWEVAVPRKQATIDRAKLRAAVRRLGSEYVFYMLDDAIDLLPPAKLRRVAGKYIDLERLRPDVGSEAIAGLCTAVKAFDSTSRAGEYYEPFMVDSRNCTQKSTGTIAWIADFHRFLDRCVAEEKTGSLTEVREPFDLLLGLLDYIDECHDDVIFFADEGGSWQVGVDWMRVLPPWFRVLSATAGPGEYAERIVKLLGHHCAHYRNEMLVVASRVANPEQRQALADTQDREASRRTDGMGR